MISMAIVFVVYTVYVLALLPWIEPQYVVKAGPNNDGVAQRLEPRQRDWMSLFAEDSWERSELTKSLESDDGVLLFQKYSRDGKGRWSLTPATLIYYAASGKKKRRPFILRPKRAVLQFNGPLNLISGGRGKLVGGRLVGDIVISSPESATGEGDDFQLTTRHVEIEAKRIWTPHDVAFRFGPHSGRGRNLTIRLQRQAGKSDGLSLGQMRSIELTQLDHLTILTENSIIPSASQLPRLGDSDKSKAKVPVVVHCRGPFQFDVAKSRASLSKNVELAREYAPSQNDYLTCQELSIYFDASRKQKAPPDRPKSKRKKATGGKKAKIPSQWAVDRIVATGEPVQLLAPSANASFFGQRLEYHPSDKQIFLKDDKKPVRLQFGQHFCSAPQILYQTIDFNRLGTLRAIGPGVYRGSGKDLRVAVTAKWQQELTLRPHQNNHVLSVHAGADVTFADANRIRAKQLHVWLKEVQRLPRHALDKPQPLQGNRDKLGKLSKKKPKPKYDIRVERFLAIGGVALDSPQLTARTNQLEGWIRHDLAAPEGQAAAAGQANGESFGGAKKKRNLLSIKDRRDKSKWDAQARLVRVQLAQSHQLDNSEIRLDSLILRDDVVLQEVATAKPEDEPVLLQGDWLRMTDGLTDNAQFIISAYQGDAIVKARGLHLFGRRIDLQQGRNLMWIDGTGRMSAPVSADLDGNKLKKPMRMTVQWDSRMQFDGLKASFKDSVLVTGPQQVLRGKQLEVTLSQRVDFAKQMERAKSPARRMAVRARRTRPEIRHLKFHGEVQAESRSFDKKGKLESVDQMWIRDLEVHRDSGKIHGLGPGRMISRQRPSANKRRRGNLLTSRSDKDDKNKLNYLQVDFRSHLSGNLHQRRITLFDDIQAIYGPIANWNSQLHNRTPDGLGKRGVEIRSSQLTISEHKKKRGEKRGPLEVTAAGNTRISGNNFAARAERLSYVEAKDLVVLESGGNNKAKIRHWSQPGGGDMRELTGRKILFWPSRGEWKLENLGSFTLEGPGTFKPKLPNRVGGKK